MEQTEKMTPARSTSSATMEYLFPFPVMYFDWPDSRELNDELTRVVLNRRETSNGVVKTNRGGWQSDTNLQDWNETATLKLIDRIHQLAFDYVSKQFKQNDETFKQGWKIRAWANVNENGHFNRAHDHLGRHSFISGVYYVKVGDIQSGAAGGGRTRFEDWTRVPITINENPDTDRRDLIITPTDGRMLIFPASLMHSVEAYQGSTQRITIAFNLYHPCLGVPRLEPFLQASDWWWTNFRGLVLARRKIPEKIYALSLIPRHLTKRRGAAGDSINSILRHIKVAINHATAQASEEFESHQKKKQKQ